MTRQVAALGSGHVLRKVDAVYGKHLSEEARSSFYSEGLNRQQYPLPLVAGEIGCYASHLLVWQMIADGQDEWAMVLEDDVTLDPKLVPMLNAIAQLPAPSWDMIKLLGRQNEQALKSWPVDDLSQLIRYRRVPSMTSAYLVSREGARKLSRIRRPFGRPVDVDLRYWWEVPLMIYGLYPYPVSLDQTSDQSTIGERDRASGLGYRLRKVGLQFKYSVSNWLHGVALSKIAPYSIHNNGRPIN
jgi:glycosyl transferase family 25